MPASSRADIKNEQTGQNKKIYHCRFLKELYAPMGETEIK